METTTDPTTPTRHLNVPDPLPGHKLANGAVVIEYRHRGDRQAGQLQHGRVLAMVPGNFHPFAVWATCAYDHEHGNVWRCETGEYFATIEAAVTWFGAR